jgi:hypothetical protein
MLSLSGLLLGLVTATSASGAFAGAGRPPLPTRLFAPYFET